MSRLAAACGVLAPASFVGAWAVGGAVREGYDPVQQAISQLAREGTAGRLGMTAGFVGFGALLPVFAQQLPRLLGAGSALRVSATVAGVSTLAVAALPLQVVEGGTGDALHAAAAGVGYVASAVALIASVTGGPTGLWQRVGLGVVDAWFASVAVWALRTEPS